MASGFADEMARRWSEDGVGKWIAHRRSDGALVGGRPQPRRGRRTTSTGARLGPSNAMRGQGFATEIGAAGIGFGSNTLGFQEIVAYTEIHNVASRAVMERLDMTFVKTIHAPGLVEGSTMFATTRRSRSTGSPGRPPHPATSRPTPRVTTRRSSITAPPKPTRSTVRRGPARTDGREEETRRHCDRRDQRTGPGKPGQEA